MTTKYINGSGLSKLLQLISNSVSQVLNSISNRLSNIDSTHANLIEVTYDELLDMRNKNNLIPGQYYRITDYVTTTSQENTISNGSIRQIIVLATDYDTLSEEAMTDNGYKVWYCLDNDTDRFAWAGTTKPVLYFDYIVGARFKRDESLVIEESDITYYGYTFTEVGGGELFNENSVLWYTEEFPEFTDDYVSHTFYQISDGKMAPINIDSKFFEKEEKIGKGVIYRMIDENGNDCPYDFKSIMFKKPNDETDDTYYYTFYYMTVGEKIPDATTYWGINRCYNNVIKYYKIDNTMYIPNNIFRVYSDGDKCYNNIIGYNCHDNTFDGKCHDNTFGDNCHNNAFDDLCYNNTFGNDCHHNTFGYLSFNNTFDSNCYNNTFGENANNNTFGYNCYNNTFGNSCSMNTFGDICHDNTFGNDCDMNTFGSDCHDNGFIYVNSSDSTQTEILNGIINCDFSNKYQYNKLKHLKPSNTNNSSHYLKNVRFCKGVKGSVADSNVIYNIITIENILPDNIETKVAINSNGELKIYCEADLVV